MEVSDAGMEITESKKDRDINGVLAVT